MLSNLHNCLGFVNFFLQLYKAVLATGTGKRRPVTQSAVWRGMDACVLLQNRCNISPKPLVGADEMVCMCKHLHRTMNITKQCISGGKKKMFHKHFNNARIRQPSHLLKQKKKKALSADGAIWWHRWAFNANGAPFSHTEALPSTH